MDDTRVEQAKFETGGAPPSIDEGELPWTYGEDRITAMARDPESAYVYWEITDEGIASARGRLGPAGAHGWCNLRVYDTTGRDFDGVNAHDYFDIGIDRRDREYFLMIRRPGSSLHVEVGLMTHEGYFQPIARSGRVDFPRSGPSPNTQLDWMTVTSEGAPPCVAPYHSRYAGPEPRLPGREGAGYVDVWHAAYAPSPEIAPPPATIDHPSGSAHHAVTHHAHIERWWSLDEWRAEWRAGLRFLHWEHHDPALVAVELLGETPAHVRLEPGGGEMVVYGPWRVTIREADTAPGRRILATWSMRWVHAITPMIETWHRVTGSRVVSSWEHEHVAIGASEATGLRRGGASEVVAVGASGRMWLGASEWMAVGASEMRWGGASELFAVAASGRMGASEWLGGSERAGARAGLGGSEVLGGSEQLGGSEGTSASRFQGASEVHGGRSERWGGRLEEGK
jgi:hypothetical protein